VGRPPRGQPYQHAGEPVSVVVDVEIADVALDAPAALVAVDDDQPHSHLAHPRYEKMKAMETLEITRLIFRAPWREAVTYRTT